MSWTQKITSGTVVFDTSNAASGLDQAPTTTTLAAAITTTAQTAITLASGTHAVDGAYIQIGTELILVESGGGTVNIVAAERGANGTTAATYSSGTTVDLPGYLTANLLTIAEAPNVELFLRKTTADINFVVIVAGSGNTFPGGGTQVMLIDDNSSGIAHIKFPGSGTVLITLSAGGGQQGPPGPAGSSATPPGAFTIGAATVEWVNIIA